MPRVVVPIFFDYASTLCYVAWRIVSGLERELNFEPLWKGVPIALRDHRTRAGRAITEQERQKVLIAAAETGIAVSPPSVWIDSAAALQGSEIARDAGVFGRYHEAVFRAAFEGRADISEPAILGDIAAGAGMDRVRFHDELASGRMASRLMAHKREADQHSALGYPTFVLGDFPMIGIQPPDTMRMVLARFIEQRETEPQG